MAVVTWEDRIPALAQMHLCLMHDDVMKTRSKRAQVSNCQTVKAVEHVTKCNPRALGIFRDSA
jgi:hypothetical protein